jgi:hypothetical protein
LYTKNSSYFWEKYIDMPAFKFRISFEDIEDVSRDIEIKPGQTFEDLHFAIQKAINFDASKPASFFISDDYWRKGSEIKSEKLAKYTMADLIDDPHKKFIYEFDNAEWVLHVELFKIVPDEEGEQYPRCVKSVGKAPKQYKKGGLKPPVTTLVDEDINLNHEDDKVDESLIYKEVAEINVDAISEDDDIESGFSEETNEDEENTEGNEFDEEFGDNFEGGEFEEEY